MPAIPFVPLIAAGVGALGSAVSAKIGGNAAKNASTAQANSLDRAKLLSDQAVAAGQSGANQSTANANDILSQSAQQQLAMYSPYADAGTGSLKSLQQLAADGGPLDQKFSFGQQDLQDDPGYQFTLAEGQKAIAHSQAAQGNLFSGSTLKSLAGYTTGLANTHFNDAFNRAANTFDINRSTALSRVGTLQGLAGLGYGATTAGANAVGNTSTQQAGNLFKTGEFNADLGLQGARIATGLEKDKGDSQAAGIVGNANSTISGISGVTGSVNRGLQDWLAQRKVNNQPYKPAYDPFAVGQNGDYHP